MLMAIAGTWISAQWASTTGSAVTQLVSKVQSMLNATAWSKHTNTHDHQEPSQEAPQLDHAAASAVHEVILVTCPAAYPVWQRRDHVGCNYEKRQVVFPQGGGEDYEEETDC